MSYFSWLQQRRVKKEHDVLPVRYTSPMPAIEKRSTEEPTKRDVHTAPEPDLSSSGKFRTRRSLQSDGRPTLYSIFSRRSELVDAGPIWQTISEVADEQDDEAGLSKPESDVGDPEGTRIADGAEDTTPPDKETASAQHREAGTDFMKELLVVNAEKRYRKKAKPIQDRLADYYRKLEEMKRRQAASEPTAWEIRRRYVLLTRGVKATLDLSDDSDDNGLETDASTPSIVKYGRHQHRNWSRDCVE